MPPLVAIGTWKKERKHIWVHTKKCQLENHAGGILCCTHQENQFTFSYILEETVNFSFISFVMSWVFKKIQNAEDSEVLFATIVIT